MVSLIVLNSKEPKNKMGTKSEIYTSEGSLVRSTFREKLFCRCREIISVLMSNYGAKIGLAQRRVINVPHRMDVGFRKLVGLELFSASTLTLDVKYRSYIVIPLRVS